MPMRARFPVLTPAPRRPLSRLALGFPVLCLVVLLVVSGESVAVPSATATTILPPFTGVTKIVLYNATTIGCGSIPTLEKHSFNLTTGKLSFDARTVAANCTGGRAAGVTLEYQLTIPITVTSRNTTAWVNWTIDANASALLDRGKCNWTRLGPPRECFQVAQAQIGIVPYLVDETNGTSYSPTAGQLWIGGVLFDIINPCYPSRGCQDTGHGGASTVSIRQSASASVSATGLNVSHRFELQVTVNLDVEAGFGCNGCTVVGGHGEASLNVKTHGNGARLDSVTLA